MSACGAPDPLAAFVPGESGRVVRVIDGDALVLDTGQSVRLVSIEAPAPDRRNRPGQPFADEAKRMVEDMVLGRQVRLYYAGLSRDRYDRALAHVVTSDASGPDLWLNLALVERGGARVRVYPDTALGAEPLLAAEANALERGAGLWALPDYAIPRAMALAADRRGFVIVDGVIGDAAAGTSNAGADFGGEQRLCLRPFLDSAVVLDIARSAAGLCDMPTGVWVRARGYLRDGRLEITHGLNAMELPGP
ncbi:MAG: thermonuclease family protein [Pseudomonadota bacterium]